MLSPGEKLSARIELRTRSFRGTCDSCPRPGLILGIVRDACTDSTIERCRIKAKNGAFAAFTDKDGMFSLVGIDSGEISLVVSHPEYTADTLSSVHTGPGSLTHLRFVLDPLIPCEEETGAVAVQVADTVDGAGIGGAVLLCVQTGLQARSDSSGQALVGPLRAGSYTLVAHHPDYALGEPLDCTVRAGDTLSMRILLRPATPADAHERFAHMLDSLDRAVADWLDPLRPADSSRAGGPGMMRGRVTHKETGLPLAGIRVRTVGPARRTATDSAGFYLFEGLPTGSLSVAITEDGYHYAVRSDIEIVDSETVRIDFELAPDDAVQLRKLTVMGEAAANTEAGLLKRRSEEFSISDAIGSDEMSAFGGGNAAETAKRVTGVTIVDGRYVFVRGLGDRYATTLLNGMHLPSPDPEKRAVALDMFPASLLDNLTVTKTFAPDNPANFAGGSVALSTRAFPRKRIAKLSLKGGLSPQTTFRDDFPADKGGTWDWLGIDDGTREVPALWSDWEQEAATRTELRRAVTDTNEAVIHRIDRQDKAFASYRFEPRSTYSFPGMGASGDFGNVFRVGGRDLGLSAALTYSRKDKSFRDGTQARWELMGHDSVVTSLDSNSVKKEDRGTSEILWGSLLQAGYRLSPEHDLSVLHLHTHNAEDMARHLYSTHHEDVESNNVFHRHIETQEIHYKERGFDFVMLRGKHRLPAAGTTPAFEWKAARSRTYQDEPAHRLFSDVVFHNTLTGDTTYEIQTQIFDLPLYSFRTIRERSYEGRADLTIPFDQWYGLRAELTCGAAYQYKARTYTQREFYIEYHSPSLNLTEVKGDMNAYSARNNMGLVDPENLDFGNRISYTKHLLPNHDGVLKIGSGYLMGELPLNEYFTSVAGVRLEAARMSIASWDTTDTTFSGKLHDNDVLPSASLIWKPREKLRFTAAYGRTLARPIFREKAEYVSYDAANEYYVRGNSSLKKTDIQNADIRCDFYPQPGELVSLSGFFKYLRDPIDRVYVEGDNEEITYRNLPEARVRGIELEARKKVWLLRFGGNFTLLHSEIDVDSIKAQQLDARRSDPAMVRPLYGASPYVLNAYVRFDDPEWGTRATLAFYTFGRRLDFVTQGSTPDVFEYPSPDMSLSLEQDITGGISLKLGAGNLLNSRKGLGHSYKGNVFRRTAHFYGRSYSAELSLRF